MLKIVVNSDATLLTYQSFKGDTFHSIGIGAILALIGVLITAILLVKRVKGGILLGIIITWILGIICELVGIYVPNPDAGMYSVIPSAIVSFDFSSFGQTFGQVFKADFSGIRILDFIVVMFAFLFVDLFDTLGTLIGVASKADMLDKDGKLPRIKGALMGRCSGNKRRRYFRYFHHHHLCRKCIRCNRRRTYGPDSDYHRTSVPACADFLTPVPYHPFLCNSSCIDHCRLLYDGCGCEDQL